MPDGIALALPPNATPLDFFQATYRDPRRSWAQRQRAAEAAAPFMHPKLAVVANLNGEGFAAALERAIARSGKAQAVHAAQVIEHQPLGVPEPTCCPLSGSLSGVKRTCGVAAHMSAFDPKRT